jgi:hypothetical protein
MDLALRATFSPAHPLADIFHPPDPSIASQSISRDVPLARVRAFRFSPLCPKGSSQTVLYCAHRGSTFRSCGLGEQKGWSGYSPPTLRRPRVARAQEINRLHPLLCSGAGDQHGCRSTLYPPCTTICEKSANELKKSSTSWSSDNRLLRTAGSSAFTMTAAKNASMAGFRRTSASRDWP